MTGSLWSAIFGGPHDQQGHQQIDEGCRQYAVLGLYALQDFYIRQSATVRRGGPTPSLPPSSSARNEGETLYVLDEPTTWLHPSDVAKLMKQLDSLVESGNTVVVDMT